MRWVLVRAASPRVSTIELARAAGASLRIRGIVKPTESPFEADFETPEDVGYGPLRRVLLGSTAAESIHHADYLVIGFSRGAEDSDP